MYRIVIDVMKFRLQSALVLLLAVAPLSAQVVQTGIIDGMVVDQAGDPIGGVFLTFESFGVNAQKVSTISDFEGNFRMPGLPPGVYYVTARLEGYVQQARLRVNLRVNQVQRVLVELREGVRQRPPETETVSFSASLYDEPFTGEIPFSANQVYQKRIRWLTEEFFLTPYEPVNDQNSLAGFEVNQLSIEYESIDLSDPVHAEALIRPGHIPFSSLRTRRAFLDSSVQPAGGALEFTSPFQDGDVSAALALDTTSSLNNRDGEFARTDSSGIAGGAMLLLPLPDEAGTIIAQSSASSHDQNRFLEPSEIANHRSLFLAARYLVSPGENSELAIRLMHLEDELQGVNAVSLRQWDGAGGAAGDSLRESDIIAGSYRQRLSDNIIVSYRAAYYRLWHQLGDEQNRETATRRDSAAAILYGGSLNGRWREERSERLDGAAGLGFFLDEITGTHQIRLGAEAEYVEAERLWGFNGGQLLEYRGGDLLFRRYTSSAGGQRGDVSSNDKMTRFSLYADDNWLISERVLLNIGIRFDGTDVENSTDQVVDWNAISPRLGVSFDIFNDSRWIARAGIARYFAPARIGWSLGDPWRVNTVYNQGEADELFLSEAYGISGGYRFGSAATVPPHTDEFFATIEFSPDDALTLSASYIYRRTTDIIDDMDFDTRNGGFRVGEFSRFVPASAVDSTGAAYTYYQRLPGEEGDFSLQRWWDTDERLFRRYDTAFLRADWRFSQNLVLRGRYSLGRVRGNIGVSGEDVSSRSGVQDTPSRFINAEGYLSSDVRHDARLIALWTGYRGLSAAALISWRSGAPYNRLLYNPDFFSQRHEIFANPRGEAYRLDDQLTIDFKIEMPFELEKGRLMIGVMIKNLLDDAPVVAVEERDVAAFGQSLAAGLPRTVSLLLRYQF